MTAKETVNMRTFPVVVDTKCKTISRIYPLKQAEVASIYDAVQGFDIVKKVYVFGSSTTGRCHVGSDLDICIEADTSDGMKVFDLQKEIGDICNWNCDIVMYGSIGNRLKNTVQQEGVIIYEHTA